MAEPQRGRGRQRERRQREPGINISWDPPEKAADDTYSVTIWVTLVGQWREGRPGNGRIIITHRGEEPVGPQIVFQQGRASHPLIGLAPEHHYLIRAEAGERQAPAKLLVVPALPTAAAKALEAERVELERAEVAKKLLEARKTPSSTQRRLERAKQQTERLKAEQEQLEAERNLQKTQEVPRKATKLEVVSTSRDLRTMTATLRRADDQGGVAGIIAYTDIYPEVKTNEITVNASGVTTVLLQRGLLARSVTFATTEGVQAVVEVPGRLSPPDVKNDIPQN